MLGLRWPVSSQNNLLFSRLKNLIREYNALFSAQALTSHALHCLLISLTFDLRMNLNGFKICGQLCLSYDYWASFLQIDSCASKRKSPLILFLLLQRIAFKVHKCSSFLACWNLYYTLIALIRLLWLEESRKQWYKKRNKAAFVWSLQTYWVDFGGVIYYSVLNWI